MSHASIGVLLSSFTKRSLVVYQTLHLFGRLGAYCAVLRFDENRRGYLSRDVRLSVPLLVVNPKYDMRRVGFETIKRMQKFGRQNAVSNVVRRGRLEINL